MFTSCWSADFVPPPPFVRIVFDIEIYSARQVVVLGLQVLELGSPLVNAQQALEPVLLVRAGLDGLHVRLDGSLRTVA